VREPPPGLRTACYWGSAFVLPKDPLVSRSFSGRRLREKRLEADVTLEELAIASQRSFYSVRDYELNRVLPPLDVLCAITAVLDCSIDDLLDAVDAVPA
jgi:transcriptional regulator with XRE-family HTH domain